MGNPLLLMRMEGPLQSWGIRARWDVRDTAAEPTKSALVGLLGCSLGYSTGDSRLVELDQALVLGVRVENPGREMVDFHTITDILPTAEGKTKGRPGDPATIVSPRAYLQDAAFLIALGGEDAVLKKCRDALLNPVWPVYLGRKSCPPTRPVFEALTCKYDSIEDALTLHPWQWEGQSALKGNYPRKLRCVMDSAEGSLQRQDALRVNPARMYAFRAVREFYIDFPGQGEEVCPCISHV